MKKGWSLRRHLSLRLAGLFAVLWIGTSAITIYIFYEEISEVFDSSLEETAHRITPLIGALEVAQGSITQIDQENLAAEDYEHDEYVTYQVRNRNGDVLLRSSDAPTVGWQIPRSNGFMNDGSWRVYTAYVHQRDFVIQIGENLEHRFFVIVEAAIALALPILISIPLFFLLFQTVLDRALHPVFEFSRAIGARDPNNLSDIDNSDLPNEFEPISSRLNNLLKRVREAFESERHFSGNSAHQLRTPVAAALAQSEMLERELMSAPQIERAKKLTEALKRLGRIVEKLLQLARADQKSDLVTKKQNPYHILQILLSDYSRLDPKPRFIVEGGESAPEIMTDPDALAIIFQNLIENALAYATPDTTISIRFNDSGVITFSNDCDVIPASVLAVLDQRFTRGVTDIRGSGLGLAIVRRLAEQLKIQIQFRSPRINHAKGFEVELSWDPHLN